jgi:hypothetical protein
LYGVGLQDSLGCKTVWSSLQEVGIVHALLATLKHQSPHCVAAAAGALGWYAKGARQGMIDANSILPALLQVVKGDIPPADHRLQTGILSRSVPRHICHSLPLILLSLQRVKVNFGESDSILPGNASLQ